MVVFSPNWTIFPATTDDHTSLKTTFPFSCCYLFPGSSNEFVSRLFRATISGTGSLSVHQERYGKECHINIFAMSHQTNVSPNFCAKGWNTLKMFNQVWASLAGRFYNVTELGAYHTVYFTFSWPMYCDCNFFVTEKLALKQCWCRFKEFTSVCFQISGSGNFDANEEK